MNLRETVMKKECIYDVNYTRTTLSIVDYVSVLGKIVASRYADGLYHQYRAVSDGKVYNVSVIYLYFIRSNEFLSFLKGNVQQIKWSCV